MKYEPKLLVWWAVSMEGRSRVYVNKSKITVRADTLRQRMHEKRLVSFINKHHRGGSVLLWPDLVGKHFSN